MRVFLDTNVWLSAIVFPGLCADLLVVLDESEHECLTSDLVRTETHEVLQRNFVRHERALVRFDLLWARATCVPDLGDPPDDADARLVAAASLAGADVFVTGDRRVLEWRARSSMRIVSPRQAWIALAAPDPPIARRR